MEPRFKKGDRVLYLDNKAEVIKFNKRDGYYTVRIIPDGIIIHALPSQVASYIYKEG